MTPRVLLSDSHRIVREGLRLLLQHHGHVEVVAEAASCREAVDLALQQRPDIVIMDAGKNAREAPDAAQRILGQLPGTKIIGLFDSEGHERILDMVRCGANVCIRKSCGVDDLLQAVEACLQKRLYLPPDAAGAIIEALNNPEKLKSSGDVLTPRECEVLRHLADGLNSPEIARELFLSVRTIEAHRRNIMRKLDLRSIAQLTKYAIRTGLTSLED